MGDVVTSGADVDAAVGVVERIADAVDRGELAAPAGWSTTARTMAAQLPVIEDTP